MGIQRMTTNAQSDLIKAVQESNLEKTQEAINNGANHKFTKSIIEDEIIKRTKKESY